MCRSRDGLVDTSFDVPLPCAAMRTPTVARAAFFVVASLALGCGTKAESNTCVNDAILKGPFVTHATVSGATVRWDSLSAGCTEVALTDGDHHVRKFQGVSESVELVSNWGNGIVDEPDLPGTITMHTVTLTDLAPSTCYAFSIETTKGPTTHRVCTTRPATDTAPMRFVALGDTNPILGYTAQLFPYMAEAKPEFILHTGDLQYYASVLETWTSWARIMQPMFSTAPFFPCLGNHEFEEQVPTEYNEYYARYFRDPAGSGENRWYTFESGGVHFFSLDTEEPLVQGSPQGQWLEGALAQALTAPGFRTSVLYFHRPIYTLGDAADEPETRAYIESIVQPNKVKLILTGHMHGYERFLVNGVTQIVTGGGGGAIGDVSKNANDPGRASYAATRQAAAARFHFLQVDVTSDKVSAKAIANNGDMLDTFEIALP